MNHFAIVLLLVCSIILPACTQESDTGEIESHILDSIPTSNFNLSLLQKCNIFNDDPSVNTLKRQDYKEVSGIAASQRNKGILYIHEDNGGGNIYMTDTQGEDLGKLVLENVFSRDFEDICVGPGPEYNKTYIYVADIGDNKFRYPSVFIYRFEEPELLNNSAKTEVLITSFDKIELVYSGGPADAETIFIDPLTKNIYIATKESLKSQLYCAPYPQVTTYAKTVTPVAKTNLDLLTSGDVSPDGSEIILRNRGQVWYWKRLTNESLEAAILRDPQDAPYTNNEHQGEGICFSANAQGYITDTETQKYPGSISTLSFYEKK